MHLGPKLRVSAINSIRASGHLDSPYDRVIKKWNRDKGVFIVFGNTSILNWHSASYSKYESKKVTIFKSILNF